MAYKVLWCLCFVSAVIGLDFIAAGNFSSIPIPKYNNKVQSPDIFDKSTRVVLPQSMLVTPTLSGKHISLFLTYSLASCVVFAFVTMLSK